MQASHKTKLLFSIIQFLNTGIFAFILAFFPVYAEGLGFLAKEIGIMNAGVMLATMLASPLILQLVKPHRSPPYLLRVSSFLTPISFLMVLYARDFIYLTISWTLFVALRIAGNTLVDVHLLKLTSKGILRFEKIRVWGSVGFVILGAIFGLLTDSFGIISATQILFIYVLIQSALSYYLAPLLHDVPNLLPQLPKRELLSALLNRRIIALFLSVGLNWLSHAPLYVYLSLYLKGIGWSSNEISLAWNVGVIAEILFFLLLRRIELKISLTSLLVVSMIVSAFRWYLLAVTESFQLILFAQFLHAFSFGACYMASIRLSYDWFPEGYKEKSQGLLTLFGVGIGSLMGRWMVTVLADRYESYADFNEMFYFASCIAILATFVSLFCIFGGERKKLGLTSN